MSPDPVRVLAAGTLPRHFSPLTDNPLVQLVEVQTEEDLRRNLPDAQILFSQQVPLTVPKEAPRLSWIHLPSAGADHLRGLPVWESDILITTSSGLYAVPIGEHVFAMLLAITRRLPALFQAQQRAEWMHDSRGSRLTMAELRGRTMGIVGWGKIGEGVAHLSRACGMRVIGTRRSLVAPREVPRDVGPFVDEPWIEPVGLEPDIVYPSEQLPEVLGQSDVVVLILPLTAETEHSFGRQEFASMKPGSIFINVGRGKVVVEDDLVAALRSGRVSAAGLDVFDHEPLPRSSPLWSMPEVIVTPHLAGMSSAMKERAARFFVLNLNRYLAGQTPFNVVERNREY